MDGWIIVGEDNLPINVLLADSELLANASEKAKRFGIPYGDVFLFPGERVMGVVYENPQIWLSFSEFNMEGGRKVPFYEKMVCALERIGYDRHNPA